MFRLAARQSLHRSPSTRATWTLTWPQAEGLATGVTGGSSEKGQAPLRARSSAGKGAPVPGCTVAPAPSSPHL